MEIIDRLLEIYYRFIDKRYFYNLHRKNMKIINKNLKHYGISPCVNISDNDTGKKRFELISFEEKTSIKYIGNDAKGTKIHSIKAVLENSTQILYIKDDGRFEILHK